MNGGTLIAIEGISGAGKTRLSKALKHKLTSLRRKILLLGGFELYSYSSPISKFLRELVTTQRFVGLPWIAECHLLLSDILYDIEVFIKPAIRNGQVVIYDNYLDSIVAFQTARILTQKIPDSDVPSQYVKQLISNLCDNYGIPKADITIYIQCDIGEAKTRLEERDGRTVSAAEIAIEREIVRQYDLIYKYRDILIIDNTRKEQWNNNLSSAINYVNKKVKS